MAGKAVKLSAQDQEAPQQHQRMQLVDLATQSLHMACTVPETTQSLHMACTEPETTQSLYTSAVRMAGQTVKPCVIIGPSVLGPVDLATQSLHMGTHVQYAWQDRLS